MGTETLTVALVSEVFWEPDGELRLADRLKEAADKGAELAVLPEIPLNPWRPATKEAVDSDAEEKAVSGPDDGARGGCHRRRHRRRDHQA
jgi:predicted amidohydrolase